MGYGCLLLRKNLKKGKEKSDVPIRNTRLKLLRISHQILPGGNRLQQQNR